MGQVPYDNATMTEAIRRAILHVQVRQRPLVKRWRIAPMPVATPRYSSSAAEQRAGTKDSCSTVLSPEDEPVVIVFRRRDYARVGSSRDGRRCSGGDDDRGRGCGD